MEQKSYEILEKKSFKDKYVEPFKFLWKYIKIYKFLFIFVVIGMLFVSLINCGVSIGQYFFTKYISDTLISINGKNDSTNLVVLIFMICLVVAVLVSTILYSFQTIFMTKIAQYSSKYLRKDLYFKILDLKLKFFDSNPSGDIMSRLTNDVNNITISLTQNVVQFIVNFSQIFFFLIALLVFSPIMGLISLVFIPIQLSVIILFFKKAQPNFFKKQIVLGEINGYVEETISGQKIINNFNKQEFVIKKFKDKNDEITNISYKANLYSNLSSPWNTLMANMLVVTLFIVAMVLSLNNVEFGTSYLPTIQNDPDSVLYGKSDPALVLSLLTAIMNFSRNFTNPIYQIFQILNLLQMALAGADRAEQIKKQENEIRDEETIDVFNLKGNINFKNLTFSYDGFNDVLKNINLSIKQGQVVGIVGPTGSGKTTIINLLTKFYDVTNENSDILIDGISIKNITKHSLRNEVSIVLQDTFIFEDTIYENMRYANPEATNEEIEEAAKKANAHSFIMSLEKGYDTVLKNNADEISQGQRQLLAITRAFLRKSSILILDEATSSIDTKTEKDIQSGMIKLSKGKTTFMIAHRLSTIKHADIIIVLKDGQILEKGNHFELLAQNGFYANMYNSKLNTPEDI